MAYNCPKCGAPAAGCDTSCDCWSPWTGWKDGEPKSQTISTEPSTADLVLLREIRIKW